MRKCGIGRNPRMYFLYTSWLIPKVAAPKGELQSPDEEKSTFSQEYPNFLSNSTRFLGSKVAIFFCGKVRKIFADYEEKSELRKNLADFSAKKGPLSTPKNESNSKKIWFFFSKNVALFSSGVDNSPVGTTTSGICRLLWRNCSLRMRKIPHFLKKIPIFSSNWGSEIGSKYANFSDFWALLPDPETTSLVLTPSELMYDAVTIPFALMGLDDGTSSNEEEDEGRAFR